MLLKPLLGRHTHFLVIYRTSGIILYRSSHSTPDCHLEVQCSYATLISMLLLTQALAAYDAFSLPWKLELGAGNDVTPQLGAGVGLALAIVSNTN